MTTIAYRDGVMASDSSTIFGTTILLHNTPKVVRLETPATIILAGCAGGAALCAEFRQWVLDGMAEDDPPDMKSFDASTISAIVAIFDKVTLGVELWIYEADGAYRANEEYLAEGSGTDFAISAMWQGGDAVDAIKAAVHFDTLTNGKVQTVKFGLPYVSTLVSLGNLRKRKSVKQTKGVNSEHGNIANLMVERRNLAAIRVPK